MIIAVTYRKNREAPVEEQTPIRFIEARGIPQRVLLQIGQTTQTGYYVVTMSRFSAT